MTTDLLFPPRPLQILPLHLHRLAVVYLRQSTVAQVQHHIGSTARQYHQQDLAHAWGWPLAHIRVIDADLGVSGSVIGGRSGFAELLALVQDGQVGAIFVVNTDRLARNMVEFSELLLACDRRQVALVIDGQVRDLHEAGDRLLATVLGAFAEHENRDRQQKLRHSMEAKIRDLGLAQGAPPPGYDAPVDGSLPSERGRTWGGHWVKSADPVVVGTITQVFTLFRTLGSVGRVTRELRRQGASLPCRVMAGPDYGTLIMQPVTYPHVYRLLRNPNYTDAFAFAKTYQNWTAPVTAPGEPPVRNRKRPSDQWVITRHHHDPYVSWEEFWDIQAQMRHNCSRRDTAPREGKALLSRLLRCAHCGAAMILHYGRGRNLKPHAYYLCRRDEALASPKPCHNLSISIADPPVVRAVLHTLAALTPDALADALAQEHAVAQQQVQHRQRTLTEADAAVALAARRYHAVDPDHALVRLALERDYEAALGRREEVARTLATAAPLPPPAATDDPAVLLQTASEVAQVWHHPAVTNEDKKELLRALLERVMLREDTPGVLQFTLHWHGGATSTVHTYRPGAMKHVILAHWHASLTAEAIADALNAAGQRTLLGSPWSAPTVVSTLYKRARTTPRWLATQQRLEALLHQGLSVAAVAAQLNAEGYRSLANHPWAANSVAIERDVLARGAISQAEE